MSFEEYFNDVNDFVPSVLRKGQYAFNLLHTVRPDITAQILATELDPFYIDSKLPEFMARVKQVW